eukprot:TRINITY_DN11123_c0_g7_i1.p1 TRINITY_DN11123_c0_g7~~TRINITY_DN11123_c0_g7_i1.p1  ORF type:complete len:753 (+),score=169.78 TRINITY_DN11123_c0_g7_i1:1458-3716(+)
MGRAAARAPSMPSSSTPTVRKPRKGWAAMMKPPASSTRARSSARVIMPWMSRSRPKTTMSPWAVVTSLPPSTSRPCAAARRSSSAGSQRQLWSVRQTPSRPMRLASASTWSTWSLAQGEAGKVCTCRSMKNPSGASSSWAQVARSSAGCLAGASLAAWPDAACSGSCGPAGGAVAADSSPLSRAAALSTQSQHSRIRLAKWRQAWRPTSLCTCWLKSWSIRHSPWAWPRRSRARGQSGVVWRRQRPSTASMVMVATSTLSSTSRPQIWSSSRPLAKQKSSVGFSTPTSLLRMKTLMIGRSPRVRVVALAFAGPFLLGRLYALHHRAAGGKGGAAVVEPDAAAHHVRVKLAAVGRLPGRLGQLQLGQAQDHPVAAFLHHEAQLGVGLVSAHQALDDLEHARAHPHAQHLLQPLGGVFGYGRHGALHLAARGGYLQLRQADLYLHHGVDEVVLQAAGGAQGVLIQLLHVGAAVAGKGVQIGHGFPFSRGGRSGARRRPGHGRLGLRAQSSPGLSSSIKALQVGGISVWKRKYGVTGQRRPAWWVNSRPSRMASTWPQGMAKAISSSWAMAKMRSPAPQGTSWLWPLRMAWEMQLAQPMPPRALKLMALPVWCTRLCTRRTIWAGLPQAMTICGSQSAWARGSAMKQLPWPWGSLGMASATMERAASSHTQLGTPVWPAMKSSVGGAKPRARAPRGQTMSWGVRHTFQPQRRARVTPWHTSMGLGLSAALAKLGGNSLREATMLTATGQVAGRIN